MGKSSVKVKDLGFATIMKELSALDGVHVTVGVHGDAGEREDGTTMALVASVHEFGAPLAGIPQRSFIRSTIDERRGQIADVTQKALGKVPDGKLTSEKAAGVIGQFVENAIKKKITTGDTSWEGLAASTIARKGSSKPLIDTGALRQAITHAVVKGKKPPKGQL